MASKLGARWHRITQSRRAQKPAAPPAPADRWQRVIAWSTAVLAITTGLPAAVTAYQVRTANEATQQQLQLGREQQALAERGQVTDRFSTATEQLASDKIAVRLGGIYALDKIMRDVPDYQAPAIEVLASFVRLNARASTGAEDLPGIPTDIEAALVVLTTRVTRRDDPSIDLTGARLPRLQISNRFDLTMSQLDWREDYEVAAYRGHLENATIVSADLRSALLVNVSFRDATIVQVNLSDALMTASDLSLTFIASADLRNANVAFSSLRKALIADSDFRSIDLRNSDLQNARINNSDLRGANLRGAWLSELRLSAVRWDKETQWPEDLYPAIRAASVEGPNGSFVATLTIQKQEPPAP